MVYKVRFYNPRTGRGYIEEFQTPAEANRAVHIVNHVRKSSRAHMLAERIDERTGHEGIGGARAGQPVEEPQAGA